MKNLICSFSIFIFLLLFDNIAWAQKKCANDAFNQALKLLNFHTNTDDSFIKEINQQSIKYLKPIKNPLNEKQVFQVIEIQGSMERMEYIIRLTYFPTGLMCVLVGEEISQIANF